MDELVKKIEQTTNEIFCEVEHGECFYDKKSLRELHEKLDTLKTLSRDYFYFNESERS